MTIRPHVPIRRPLRRAGTIAGAALVVALLSGCSGTGAQSAKVEESATDADATITVESCGKTITLDGPPKRVLFQNAIGVAQMAQLGVLDTLVAHAGDIDTSLYAPEQREILDKVPVLGGTDTGHGHTKLSTEAILDADVDLVVGYPSGVEDRDKVMEAGVPVYFPSSYCPDRAAAPAKFSDITDDMTAFGTMFGLEDKAAQINDALRKRIDSIETSHDKEFEGKTGAFLFITPGDTGTISVYANQSMAQVQMDALGIKNPYADLPKRVNDISAEDLLEKNPDFIVLLHTAGTNDEVLDTFKQIRGTEKLKAFTEGNVTVMAYPLVDPPSPLTVEGAEKLPERLSSTK
ncbi:ABC transporter substrate-binding protein [Corynebacterium sp.]|uniref:ABC transporter substrate-binding protein n=1 Tax=Corynebacterium sp. TaxID=1720 RepID=UPI0026DB605B|nr:ABC transporter substrate-binding protein [Corynebacterium sp.]MDO4610751.1 ABC transporter substrate-binding protein [Corynebacterium sp.]